jgi:hypothetical protein
MHPEANISALSAAGIPAQHVRSNFNSTLERGLALQ